ncbi:MAG: hypothetical protein RL154_1307, partial [Pseudomonadota bacterium]
MRELDFMNINQSEIWLVNFEPSVGSEIQKTRPAIVFNNNCFSRLSLMLVVPIIGWKDYYMDFPWIIKILPNAQNNLTKISAIECLQVKSFDESRFID